MPLELLPSLLPEYSDFASTTFLVGESGAALSTETGFLAVGASSLLCKLLSLLICDPLKSVPFLLNVELLWVLGALPTMY